MNKLLFLLSILFLVAAVSGCESGSLPATTHLPPTQILPPIDLSDLIAHLHWLGHASFRLDGPPTIYFDPAGSFTNEPPQADIILISHSHSDHYSPTTLKRLSTPETMIIASQAAATLAQLDGIPGKIYALRPGERRTVGVVEIEGVSAYNLNKSYHPKEAEGLGFIVTLFERRIYFAGDTDLIPEMNNIRVDLALLPIGGTYTMDAKEAAQAAAILKPKRVVPMHALDTNLEQFRDLCNCDVIMMKDE